MKKNTKKFLSVLLSAFFIISSFTILTSAESNKLCFGDDGKFTILQIADTQDDRYLAHELKGFIEKSIELSKPDLIVFTGDTVENSRTADFTVDDEGWREGVTDNKDYKKTLSNTKSACEQIFSIVNDRGIPFAVSQGNNDYSSGVKNSDWLEIYSSFENCLVKDESPDSEGRIDYSLPIYSSDGEKVAFNLYLMDTAHDEVTAEQIDWYINRSNDLKTQNGETVKSFVFQHIPVVDIGNLFEECKPFSKGAVCSKGRWFRLSDRANGHFELLYKPGKTSEQFTAWKQQGDVIGAYFGHIHSDGYTGTWDGIELGLTYGAQFAKSGPYGVRVLTINENNVENFENKLYTYSNGRFTLQNGNEPSGQSLLDKIVSFFRAVFANLF